MKKIFSLLLFIVIVSSGCIQEANNVNIEVKQVIPLTPGAYIEISKELNMSELKFESPQKYISTDSYFKIPIVITNNKDIDFDSVYLQITCTSPIIQDLYPYSYSGKPFENVDENFYKFDTRFLARQENDILIFGKSNNLEQNLNEGSTDFTIVAYGESSEGQLIQIASINSELIIQKIDSNV